MKSSQSKHADTGRLPKMMTLCIGSTLIGLLALLIANLIPGSPTGGPDGPYIIVFLLFIIFLYAILPVHVIGGVATAIKYFSAQDKTRFIFPLLYFVVWFSSVFLYFVLSGSADPVFQDINDRKFHKQHENEMALITILMHDKDDTSVPELIGEVDDINLSDPEFGMTALQWAAKNSSAEIVRRLLGAGADPKVKYYRDWTINQGTISNASVLDLAAWSEVESHAKVDLLIKAGVTPSGQSLVGACESGNLALIDLLGEHGTELQTAIEGKGLSCFHMAAQKGDVDLIHALFSRGAVPNTVTNYELMPLDLAMARNQTQAAIALLKGAAPANQPRRLLTLLAEMPQEDFDEAITHKPLAHLANNDARSALSNAVAACDVTIIRRYFAAGLSLTEKQREATNIPEHCEFKQLIVQIIRPKR